MATFTNRATLSYKGNVTNSNTVTGEITEVLTLTKASLNTCYNNECGIIYTVSLINSGATPLNGLTVTDDLGAYVYDTSTVLPLSYVENSVALYVNGVLQTPPTATSGESLVFTGINIPAASNALLIYRADTTEFAPLTTGSVIENTATVTGDGILNPVADTATTAVCDNPQLEITKALSPTVVNDNGTITYTITVLNYGNTATIATDDTVVSDVFNPVLNPITVTLNGALLTSPDDYTYDTTTGEFATLPGVITVPAAAYTQDATGAWITEPGVAVLTITGTV
jgi:hypothetical protein